MDAVTFMDAMRATPEVAATAPPPRPRRLSANTALIATVGILLLAMGVGVLIGRSGNHSVASAPVALQVIKVGGGGEVATKAPTAKTTIGGGSGTTAKKQKPAALKKQAETQAGAEEVLKPANGVKLPKASTHLGEKCSGGTAGCKGGEFTGEFFGE